jgi:hypothetical protein
MMAADDLTQCIPIIQRAQMYFKGRANTLHQTQAHECRRNISAQERSPIQALASNLQLGCRQIDDKRRIPFVAAATDDMKDSVRRRGGE